MYLRIGLCGLLLGAVVCSVSLSQDKPASPKDGAANKQQDMAAEMEAIKPGPQHKELAKMAGEWTTVTKFSADPNAKPEETTGSAKIATALEGRFITEEDSGTMMGMPYNGMRMTGYNNAAKQYEASWAWTLSTAILRMTGKSSDHGKTVTYAASFAEADGAEEKMTVVVKQIDDDHFVVDMSGKYPDGSNGPHLETMYTRKK